MRLCSKIKTFSAEGAQTPPHWGAGHSLPKLHPLGAVWAKLQNFHQFTCTSQYCKWLPPVAFWPLYTAPNSFSAGGPRWGSSQRSPDPGLRGLLLRGKGRGEDGREERKGRGKGGKGIGQWAVPLFWIFWPLCLARFAWNLFGSNCLELRTSTGRGCYARCRQKWTRGGTM